MSKFYFNDGDYKRNRIAGSLGYFLFFLPIIANSRSEYCRFTANQGLIFFLAIAVMQVCRFVFSGIPLIGGILSFAFNLGMLACLVVDIVYMVLAIKGDVRELPFVGHIRILR